MAGDPAAARGATLGLVLDGGRGRRMGGVDKGLMILGGRPMIVHAVERLRPQAASLAISANGDPARFVFLGLPVLPDDPPDFSGPLAGVLAGLEYCARVQPGLTHVATLPGDTPFTPSNFVDRLHEARRARGADIAVAEFWGPDASCRRPLAGRDRRRAAPIDRRRGPAQGRALHATLRRGDSGMAGRAARSVHERERAGGLRARRGFSRRCLTRPRRKLTTRARGPPTSSRSRQASAAA